MMRDMREIDIVSVRDARPDDATEMAHVHVASWRETYRGLMPDDVLDAPDFLARRERFWTAALTDPRYSTNRVAVAEAAGVVVGIAMSGPAREDAGVDSELYLIYLLESAHGSGAGQALLDAVIDPSASVGLWVADPNPRAWAFYARNGFRPDGSVKHEDGIREVRMVRPPVVLSA